MLAAAIWGSHWSGKIVLFRVDNIAVVEAINARDAHLMHLIRLLVFFVSYHSFWFNAAHAARKDNSLADALFRDNIPLFLLQVPSASPQPTAIAPSIVTLVAHGHPSVG